MYYEMSDFENLSEYRLARFVDFCVANYISILELIHMVRDLKLHTEGYSFWWKEIKDKRMVVSEIKNELNAVLMTLNLD